MKRSLKNNVITSVYRCYAVMVRYSTCPQCGTKKVEIFPSKILKSYACLDCMEKAMKQRDLELHNFSNGKV